MTLVLLIFYRINKVRYRDCILSFCLCSTCFEFRCPTHDYPGGMLKCALFLFLSFLLPSLPLSYVRSFLFPMMTGAWGGHIPWIPLLSDTPLNYPPFNSSLNKNKWQVDLSVCVCTFASSLVFQIKDSALKATSSTLLTPQKTSL